MKTNEIIEILEYVKRRWRNFGEDESVSWLEELRHADLTKTQVMSAVNEYADGRDSNYPPQLHHILKKCVKKPRSYTWASGDDIRQSMRLAYKRDRRVPVVTDLGHGRSSFSMYSLSQVVEVEGETVKIRGCVYPKYIIRE